MKNKEFNIFCNKDAKHFGIPNSKCRILELIWVFYVFYNDLINNDKNGKLVYIFILTFVK
jgi:hypothetical protein